MNRFGFTNRFLCISWSHAGAPACLKATSSDRRFHLRRLTLKPACMASLLIHNTQPLFYTLVSTCCFPFSSSPSLVFSVSLSFPPSSLTLSGSCWGAEWSEPRWSHHVFISLYSPFTFFSHRKPIRVGRWGTDWLSMERHTHSHAHTHTHPLTLLCAHSHSSSGPRPFHPDSLRVSMTEPFKWAHFSLGNAAWRDDDIWWIML